VVFVGFTFFMRSDNVVYAIAGVVFGLIAGWIIGAQQASSRTPVAPPAETTAAPAPAGNQAGARAAALDESQVQALQSVAQREPSNPGPRTELANLYFDAEKYGEAIKWYEEAARLAPNDPNVSTDLGVSYYYSNQPDKALEQFAHSLSLDPKHTKTLLNVGIVKAFGKQDLQGAAEAWRQVIQLAPDSVEAQAAKRALESLRSAHPNLGGEQKPCE
jgi:cytochrome c-type biogenesis protein CcmH/NrfG